VRDSGVGGTSRKVTTSQIMFSRVLTRYSGRSDIPGMFQRFFRVKAQRSDGVDAYAYQTPLGGRYLCLVRSRVKILDHLGLDDSGGLSTVWSLFINRDKNFF
jgi:hypothetical protein